MSDDSIHDVLVLNTCDDSDRAPVAAAFPDVDTEGTFQALSPDHSGVALGGRASFRTGDSLHTLAAFSWCDQSAPAVIWHQDAVIAGEVDAGFGYQGSKPGNEIHRFEGHLCRSIPVGCLQGVNHFAGGAQ